MTNEAANISSSELLEAVRASKILKNAEIGADWCLSLRGGYVGDAMMMAASLVGSVGGYWWDVLDVLETRRIAACRLSKE